MSLADNPIFHNLEAAREWLEAPFGPRSRCPHCGLIGAPTHCAERNSAPACTSARDAKNNSLSQLVLFLRASSHIPLNKWLFAFSSYGSEQERRFRASNASHAGIPIRSAWFMCHRIRAALAEVAPCYRSSAARTGSLRLTKLTSAAKKRTSTRASADLDAKAALAKLLWWPWLSATAPCARNMSSTVNGEDAKANSTSRGRQTFIYLMTDDSYRLSADSQGFCWSWIRLITCAEEYVRRASSGNTDTVENYFSILKRGITRRLSPCFRRCI